ncbi:Hypothetical predicted protein [Podarcis lilfordi]|uniref:Z280C/D-like C2H2 zinc finger domain-containing protein n=2 Tax=Podarcis lilfordi TaxID=74358 RepID=A0AA35QR57_9SAUR|nr:Hypothetical predicted protein [Podarcis lilfordi]
MMSFHSARQSKRFWIYKTHSEDLRGVTLVCLNCEFLTDASGLDNMATHLNENLTHTCQVIIENVPSDCLVADNISHLVSDASSNSGGEETSQVVYLCVLNLLNWHAPAVYLEVCVFVCV